MKIFKKQVSNFCEFVRKRAANSMILLEEEVSYKERCCKAFSYIFCLLKCMIVVNMLSYENPNA